MDASVPHYVAKPDTPRKPVEDRRAPVREALPPLECRRARGAEDAERAPEHLGRRNQSIRRPAGQTQVVVDERRPQRALAVREEEIEARLVRRLDARHPAPTESPVALREPPIEQDAHRLEELPARLEAQCEALRVDRRSGRWRRWRRATEREGREAGGKEDAHASKLSRAAVRAKWRGEPGRP